MAGSWLSKIQFLQYLAFSLPFRVIKVDMIGLKNSREFYEYGKISKQQKVLIDLKLKSKNPEIGQKGECCLPAVPAPHQHFSPWLETWQAISCTSAWSTHLPQQ